MDVAVTGASGLIGSALARALEADGHRVLRVVRPSSAASGGDTVTWSPADGTIDRAGLEGIDAVVHLAGENIAEGRLSDAKRARLRDQRVGATGRLLASLARLPAPPRVVVSAAAIGFYGHRGEDVLDESSAVGAGFLAARCADWEQAALSPSSSSSPSPPWRAVALRIGIALSPRGGALQKALPAFLAGVGGPFGDGQAWMPWVAIDDLGAIVLRAIVDERMAGVVVAAGPAPARNREFAGALGRVLRRPALVPLPRFALKLVVGDVADHIFESCRVEPARLRALGHAFRHASLDDALHHVLGR